MIYQIIDYRFKIMMQLPVVEHVDSSIKHPIKTPDMLSTYECIISQIILVYTYMLYINSKDIYYAHSSLNKTVNIIHMCSRLYEQILLSLSDRPIKPAVL